MKKLTNIVLLAFGVAAVAVIVLRPQRTSNNANIPEPHATSVPFQFCRVNISVDTNAVEDAYKKGEATYSQLEVARIAGERRRHELGVVIGSLENNGLSAEKGEDCLEVGLSFLVRHSSLRQVEVIDVKDYTGHFVPYTVWSEEYPDAEKRLALRRIGYEPRVDPVSGPQLIAAAGRWKVPAEKQQEAVETEKARRRELANAAKARAVEQEIIRQERIEAERVQLPKDLREKSLANCDAFEARVRVGQSTLTQEENKFYLRKCQEVRDGKLNDVWQKQ